MKTQLLYLKKRKKEKGSSRFYRKPSLLAYHGEEQRRVNVDLELKVSERQKSNRGISLCNDHK